MIESFIANLANLFPFGYAFGAGMVTTVSPCGIAMLPAYISFFLGKPEGNLQAQSAIRRTARALAMSGMVTLGLIVFFGIMGALLSLGGQFLMRFIPWAAVIIGAFLILLGFYILFGGKLYTSLPAQLANRLAGLGGSSLKGFLVFGIAYGIAALSCTLPVFLAVVGSAMAFRGFTAGLLQFISFALGMGFIISIVTISSALFNEAVNRWLRRFTPIIARLSGLLLIFAGGYILYFWFKVGDILG